MKFVLELRTVIVLKRYQTKIILLQTIGRCHTYQLLLTVEKHYVLKYIKDQKKLIYYSVTDCKKKT